MSLTDVHLLLGRLDPARFGIPVVEEPAREAFEALCATLEAAGAAAIPRCRTGAKPWREALLEGFLRIADERMADAVRRISVRRGYDPRRHAMVSFGGAGGLHACSVAELLGIGTVLVPRDAGLLSAFGLGVAVVERFAQRQVLRPLEEVGPHLAGWLEGLAAQAVAEVASEGISPGEIEIRRRFAFVRFVGQENALEIDLSGAFDAPSVARLFHRSYEELYGYRPAGRAVEVESLRVVASSRPVAEERSTPPEPRRLAPAARNSRAFFAGGWHEVEVFDTADLVAGDQIRGPALVLDDFATLVVLPRWEAVAAEGGTVVLVRRELG